MAKMKHLEIKLRYVFFILLGFWVIDFITTIIALNCFTGFVEANPIAAQLFNLGWYGWFMSFSMTIMSLFLFTLLVGYAGKVLKKLEKEKNTIGYYNFYITFIVGVFAGFEIIVIINNISLLL